MRRGIIQLVVSLASRDIGDLRGRRFAPADTQEDHNDRDIVYHSLLPLPSLCGFLDQTGDGTIRVSSLVVGDEHAGDLIVGDAIPKAI
jgi:hypothetical protein